MIKEVHQESHDHLEELLIFGSSPETLSFATRDAKINHLMGIVNTQLLKQVLEVETVRAPAVLFGLLQLLAFQIGREQSVGELAKRVGVDGKTVSRYLELLEKSGIILCLPGFGRQLPSEITRKSRYYFIDNGIRNALLSQFNRLELRGDAEQLWENFVIVQRRNKLARGELSAKSYFWRTYAGQQLELVEEMGGTLSGYGFKLSASLTPRLPKAWLVAYPEAHYHVINLNNYLEFIS